MYEIETAYEQLSYYTLSLQDNEFIHQHIVDAYAAQMANKNTKPISLIFALVGLYLCIEKNYNGREIQKFHMKMAKQKMPWPNIELPIERGKITPNNILKLNKDNERKNGIYQWCETVWKAYQKSHPIIIQVTESYSKQSLF